MKTIKFNNFGIDKILKYIILWNNDKSQKLLK